jgi:hypothetical protein
MSTKPNFVITFHAQQRFAERCAGNISNLSTLRSRSDYVWKTINDGITAATRLKEKTHSGELLYVNPYLDAVFIVKPDGYRLIVVSILSLATFEELKEQRRKEIELASDPAITLPRKPEKRLVHIEQLQASIESLKAKNAILRDEVLRLSQELAEFRKSERQAIFKAKAKR